MKKYIAVLEIVDDEEIVDAKISYIYSRNGMNYKATERMELKEESEDAKDKTYEGGLNEAWELARRIVCLPEDGGETVKWLENTFGTARTHLVFRNYSASEVIEKIKEYEEFKVGDEVVDKKEWRIKGVVTDINETYISIVQENGRVCKWKKEDFRKTGRNFPEIEKVLKQMKEGEDE